MKQIISLACLLAVIVIVISSFIVPGVALASTVSQLIEDTHPAFIDTMMTAAGERFESWPASMITSMDVLLRKYGSPTGTIYLRVRRASDLMILGTLGSKNVNTLTSDMTYYTFNTGNVSIPEAEDILILLEYSGGNINNFVETAYGTCYPSDLYADGIYTEYYGVTWFEHSGLDFTWRDLTWTAGAGAGVPDALTLAYGNLTETSVTLWGKVADDGNDTCTGRFSWGQGGFWMPEVTSEQTGLVTDSVVSAELTGLSPSTTYWYIFEVWNDAGYDAGNYEAFITNGPPYGNALEPFNVTSVSADFRGELLEDGGGNTTAIFSYAGGGIPWDNPVIVNVGNVTEATIFSETVSGLMPDTLYWYWITFSNEYGDYLTSDGSSGAIYFRTLEAEETSVPVVATLPATFVNQRSADVNGVLLYDGNLPCYVGFKWKAASESTWHINELSGQHHSIANFVGHLSNLLPDTTYQYQAYAKNGLATEGVFGNVTTFTTLHAAGVTPTATGGIWPPGIPFPFTLNSMTKLILAIIINIGAVILVAAKLSRSKGVGIATLGTGIGFLILFVAVGWYPIWIILFVGAVVGLLALLVILGGRH